MVHVLGSPPPGGDGPSTLAIVWRGVHLPFEPPAIAAVQWNDRLVVTDQARVAWSIDADGRRARLTDRVSVPPIASDDGHALALVRDDGALAIAEDGVVRVVARGLPSCGPLRFSPARDVLVYVGVSPGGVAGLHALALRHLSTPVCLSNCTLHVGAHDGWSAAFVATPSAGSLRFERNALTWDGGPRLSLGAVR